MTRGRWVAVVAAGVVMFGAAFAVGYSQTHGRGSPQRVGLSAGAATTSSSAPPETTIAPTTTVYCPLTGGAGATQTVPVNDVCSASGAPHFTTPDDAMVYLAAAWNSDNVRQIDYVTDPGGRAQMDSMAKLMVNLRFKSCSRNPAGDYTCFFMHDIAPSTSPTTYPNPGGYPPGEAVFTVAPAGGPGWYLTFVVHCG